MFYNMLASFRLYAGNNKKHSNSNNEAHPMLPKHIEFALSMSFIFIIFEFIHRVIFCSGIAWRISVTCTQRESKKYSLDS